MIPPSNKLAKLKDWITLFLSLFAVADSLVTPILLVSLTSPVLAQTTQDEQLFKKGVKQFNQSYFQEALKTFKTVLDITRKNNDHNLEAWTLNYIGLTYTMIGKYNEALKFYQQGLVISKQLGSKFKEVVIIGNIGSVYQRMGKYAKALDFYQQGLSIAKEFSYYKEEGYALGNIALIYKSLGQYEKSLDFYQRALIIYKQTDNNKTTIGYALTEIGSAYQNLRQYNQALEYYQQALAIHKQVGNSAAVGVTLNGIGEVYQNLKQYFKALTFYQQSLKIFREIGERRGEATSLNNTGFSYYSLGRYVKAIEFYQQSLTIFQEIGDHEGEGLTLSNLGYLYEQQRQPELAIIFFKQSVIVREGIRVELRNLDRGMQESYTESVAGTYRSLADLLLSQDRIYEAQQVLELLKLQEIQDFTRSQRARGELPEVVLLPQEKEIIAKYGKLVAFAVEIEQCEATNCSQLSALRDQRDNLKRQYNQDVKELETAIRQRDAQDDQFLLPTSFNRTADRIIQASNKYNLEKGTAVIYPLILQDKLWILWATQGKVIGKPEVTNLSFG